MKAVNDAPVATADILEVNEDTRLSVPVPGILINDTDVEGKPLTAIKVSGPTHGRLTLNSNGSLTYKSFTNWNGTDSFVYKAKDGVLTSNKVTVSIIVHPVNDAPVAVSDRYSMVQDTTLDVPGPGLLINDKDIDGDVLNAIPVTPPSNGELLLNADGSFSYTPNPGFIGSNSFGYAARDNEANSNTAIVTIMVNKLNLPPLAVEDSYTVNEDRSVTISAPGFLANNSDPEGVQIRGILVTKPAHGAFTFRANGWFYYKPAPNWNGVDSFTYKVSDGVHVSEPTTVTITVNPVNDAPVAVANAFNAEMNMDLNVLAPGVLANDKEFDGDALTAILVRNPVYGALTFNEDGSFIYVPKPYFLGTDTFKYKVSDGVFTSYAVTVTIRVKRPVYTFSGFLAPVENKPTLNRMTAGESIPIRFGLGGDRGLMIFARGYPTSSVVSCSATAAIADVQETNSDEVSLIYNASLDQYTYTWVTDPAWAGTCRRFKMLMNNGATYSAIFKFQ